MAHNRRVSIQQATAPSQGYSIVPAFFPSRSADGPTVFFLGASWQSGYVTCSEFARWSLSLTSSVMRVRAHVSESRATLTIISWTPCRCEAESHMLARFGGFSRSGMYFWTTEQFSARLSCVLMKFRSHRVKFFRK